MAEDNELVRLRSRIAVAATGRGGHRQFEDDLRAAIVAWVAKQMSKGKARMGAAQELGVSDASVRRWMANGATAVREVVLRERPAEQRGRASELRLVLRSGAEVHGLEVEDVITIVRALA
jgi:hypothetical protein